MRVRVKGGGGLHATPDEGLGLGGRIRVWVRGEGRLHAIQWRVALGGGSTCQP